MIRYCNDFMSSGPLNSLMGGRVATGVGTTREVEAVRGVSSGGEEDNVDDDDDVFDMSGALLGLSAPPREN